MEYFTSLNLRSTWISISRTLSTASVGKPLQWWGEINNQYQSDIWQREKLRSLSRWNFEGVSRRKRGPKGFCPRFFSPIDGVLHAEGWRLEIMSSFFKCFDCYACYFSLSHRLWPNHFDFGKDYNNKQRFLFWLVIALFLIVLMDRPARRRTICLSKKHCFRWQMYHRLTCQRH